MVCFTYIIVLIEKLVSPLGLKWYVADLLCFCIGSHWSFLVVHNLLGLCTGSYLSFLAGGLISLQARRRIFRACLCRHSSMKFLYWTISNVCMHIFNEEFPCSKIIWMLCQLLHQSPFVWDCCCLKRNLRHNNVWCSENLQRVKCCYLGLQQCMQGNRCPKRSTQF